MKLSDIQNEGKVGDSLKIAGQAATGLAGDVKSAVGNFGKETGRAMASAPGVLATGFARAIGFDRAQSGIGTVQKGIARQKFIGTFVSKIQGFLASTEEAYKDDIALLQKQIQQAQQQKAQQGAPVQESFDYATKLKVYLREAQEVENFVQQYAATIEQAITNYMSGQVGNLGGTIKSTSMQIAQMIVTKQNPINLIKNLGAQLFDQYYAANRQEFVQSHPAADTPLSPEGEQVLKALKGLRKTEQDVVIQKLKQGGNLF
jgi:hypothetical protein